jgi:hypothetical protein
MSKIQSLLAVRGGGTRDPDRLSLQVAISAAVEARRARDAAAAARGRALRMCDEAEDRLAAAKSGVAAARDNLARATVTAATEGTRLAPDSEMRNARAEEQAADDSLIAARAALAAVEAALEGPIEASKLSERRVGECVRTILARHIEPAIADVVRAKASLADALGVLHLLQTTCVEPWPPNAELTRLRKHLLVEARGGVCFEIDYEGNRAAARWAKYADELKTSADAEPPV